MGKLVNETSICYHDYENENSNWKRDLKEKNILPNSSCIQNSISHNESCF